MFYMLSMYFVWGQVRCRRFAFFFGGALCFIIAQSIAYAETPPWSPEPDSKVLSTVAERWKPPRHANRKGALAAEELVLRSIKGGKGIDGATALIAQTYKLPKSLARELVVLVVAKAWFIPPSGYYRERKTEKLECIREGFLSLIKKSKYNKDILAAAQGFVGLGRRCYTDKLFEIVADAPNPMALGMEFAKKTYCTALIGKLNKLDPGNRAVAWTLATGRYYLFIRSSRRLALLEDLSKRLRASSRDDPLFAHTVAVQWKYIHSLLDVGLADQAIKASEELPSDVKNELIEGKWKRVESTLDGLPFLISRDSSRDFLPKSVRSIFLLDLAAAHLSLGQRIQAMKLFSRLGWNGAEIAKEMHAGPRPRYLPAPVLKWLLLDRLLRNSKDDPYPWVRSAFGEHASGSLNASRVWADLSIRSLKEDGYRKVRKLIQRQWISHWIFYGEQRKEDPETFAHFDKTFQQRSEFFHRKLEENIQTQVEKDLYNELAMPRGMSYHLRFSFPPPWRPFVEKPLPVRQRTKRKKGPGRYVPPKLPDGVAPLPGSSKLLRFEAKGRRAVALSRQNRGELGGVSSGIQVHLSSDGGKTWKESLVLHFGDDNRYGIMPDSKRRLLVNDILEPEVSGRSCIQFPLVIAPLEFRHCFRSADIYLRIPIAALRADADHDGMTDILEKRLLLDPNNPDTDGDGLKDGEDPTPNVPLTVKADPDFEWRIVLLNEILSSRRRSRANVEPVSQSTRARVAKKVQQWSFDKDLPTIVLQGDKRDWGALLPKRRIIVMSRDEVRQHQTAVGGDPASKKLWPIYFHLVVFNRDHTKGFITWSWGCCLGARGGTIEVTKTKTGWTAESISGWIS